ncbi:MAG: universal stress protein [Opitutales bacterium]
MLHGDTAPSVIDYVQENEIDMLVMGAYGHTRIRRLIIGSSTTEMLRGCQLPTLLFR